MEAPDRQLREAEEEAEVETGSNDEAELRRAVDLRIVRRIENRRRLDSAPLILVHDAVNRRRLGDARRADRSRHVERHVHVDRHPVGHRVGAGDAGHRIQRAGVRDGELHLLRLARCDDD